MKKVILNLLLWSFCMLFLYSNTKAQTVNANLEILPQAISFNSSGGQAGSFTQYVTTSSSNIAGVGTMGTISLKNTTVWLEAECGSLGSLWNIVSDGSASNGAYVTIQSGNNSTANAPTSTSGQISYSFSVTQSGDYIVWGRVITPTADDDSYWVQMDGGSCAIWNGIPTASSWQWDDVHNSHDNTQTVTYSLSAGTHTLTIAFREDGTLLDKIYITALGDTPSGEGPTASNVCSVTDNSINPYPSWTVSTRYFQNGPSGAFDEISVKDPSIVFANGQYHLFYTGRDNSYWRMGYASATSLPGLSSATHTYLSSLNGGSYFCAPQVFYFKARGKWYLIYQSGLGATYSTNTSIGTPGGWTAGSSMGFNDGIDFWCISDGSNVYCFYSSQDGTYTIKRRSTSVANFPTGWSSATVVATNTFEAPSVYKNLADGKYYMIVEDLGRYQELWTADNLGGTWTQVSEEWAHNNDLSFLADDWTDEFSHCEVIRAGTDELLEVSNLNDCIIIFQGVPSGSYATYASIPYDLGIATNGNSANLTKLSTDDNIELNKEKADGLSNEPTDNKFSSDGIIIYPNPAKDLLYIDLQALNTDCSGDLRVLTLSWVLVKNQILTVPRNNVDISDLKPGLYIIQISVNNKLIRSSFIKE